MRSIRIITLALLVSILAATGLLAGGLSVEQRCVSVGGRRFTVKVVSAPLDRYRPMVGLAKGRVGATESLKGIALRTNAAAAINGCFFDAYTKDPVKPPYHNLEINRQYVHLGNTGTSLGFDETGEYRMDRIEVKVRGTVDGRKSWYAYFVNHPPVSANTATLFTSHWVGGKTPACGTQIVFTGGAVTGISAGSVPIARDNSVLLLKGGEKSMANRFRVGAPATCDLCIVAEDPDFWLGAKDVMGCGPRLVKNGEVYLCPKAEGFRQDKILSLACQRSAVGITLDRRILLVTCPGATIKQLAQVMKSLGSYDAMNLDGGASSSLYANGRYITAPSRDLSNALVLVPR